MEVDVMTDYTDLPNASVAQGGLAAGTTVTALRDNPLSIAEGDPTAPAIKKDALSIDRATDIVAVSTTAGTESNIWDGYGLVQVNIGGNPTGTTARFLEMRLSNDGGASWSSAGAVSVSIRTGSSNIIALGAGIINLVDGTYIGHSNGDISNATYSYDFSKPNANAIKFELSGSGPRFNVLLLGLTGVKT
jgi:hypothetical protein